MIAMDESLGDVVQQHGNLAYMRFWNLHNHAGELLHSV